MKIKYLVIFNAVTLAAVLFLVVLHFIEKPKIAYVKSSILLSEYEGFKMASKDYMAKSAVWQANIDTLRSEFQKSIRDFESSKNSMTKKEIELSEKILSEKQKQVMQYQEGIQQKAKEEDQKMTQKVVDEVNNYIKEYGEEHNYEIIFGATETGNVVYAKEALDITEQVVEGLNNNLRRRQP